MGLSGYEPSSRSSGETQCPPLASRYLHGHTQQHMTKHVYVYTKKKKKEEGRVKRMEGRYIGKRQEG